MSAEYYINVYGGLYQFISEATNTEDKNIMIVYKHIYPFEEKTYVRRKDEFYEKFKQISEQDLMSELSKDKQTFQNMITENKNKK